jgi:AraC family transcriptional regulator
MNVDIVTRPEVRVAALDHTGPYEGITEVFGRLGPIVSHAGLRDGKSSLIAIYKDDPAKTPAEKLRSQAGITIASSAKVPPGLKDVRIAGGRYAHAVHAGAYSELGAAWQALQDETLTRSGNRPRPGPSYEIYRNTPMNAKPDELRTDLYLPLE